MSKRQSIFIIERGYFDETDAGWGDYIWSTAYEAGYFTEEKRAQEYADARESEAIDVAYTHYASRIIRKQEAWDRAESDWTIMVESLKQAGVDVGIADALRPKGTRPEDPKTRGEYLDTRNMYRGDRYQIIQIDKYEKEKEKGGRS